MITEKPNISLTARIGICEAAKVMAVSKSTIDYWTRNNKLRCHYHAHNGRRFWTGADLIHFWQKEY